MTPVRAATPTVVLVHGAFADASGWTGAIQRPHHDDPHWVGNPVYTPAEVGLDDPDADSAPQETPPPAGPERGRGRRGGDADSGVHRASAARRTVQRSLSIRSTNN